MADKIGKMTDNGQVAYYIEEGTNKPYTMGMVNGKPTGKKSYLSPMAMGDYSQPADKGGFIHGHEQWNSKTGEMERPTNWGNIMAAGVGGAIAAPFVIPALASAAGGAAGGASGAQAAGAGSALLGEGGTAAGLSAAGATPGLIGGSALLGEGGAAAGLSAAGATPGLIGGGSTLLGEGGTAAGLSASGATPGLIGGSAPAATGGLPAVAAKPKWADLLHEGGNMLTEGAQQSANEDAANNNNAANWLRALDEDYRTKTGIAVAAPAALNRQAMWGDYGTTAQTSNPDAPKESLLTPSQQAMAAAQRDQILKKLAVANAQPMPTAPEVPEYQKPGKGTKAASIIGTGMNIGSRIGGRIPWGKIF